jgi:hypothetical protein
MSPTFDNIMLLVIVVQGFGVWWLEYKVYKIHSDRSDERARWRESKRKAAERKIVSPSEAVNGPVPSNGGDVAKNI